MSEAVSKRSGWTTVAFGDVVKKVTDKVDPEESGLERYVAGEHMDTDDLRIRRWGEIGDGYLGPAFHMRFKPGQVLYGSRRTYLRKVALADFEGITANTTYVLESKDPKILLPELLQFIMQAETFHEHSKRESKGSVNPYVNFSDLAWYEFALPPLEEQRRISEVLHAFEDTLESIHATINSATCLEASFLENALDPDRNEWQLTTIGETFEVASGGTPSRKIARYWDGPIPWLTTSEITFNTITCTSESITDEGLKNSSAKMLPVDSIIVALFGATRGRSGRTAIELCTNQACASLLPNADNHPSFTSAWIKREHDRLKAKGRGSAQPNLNLTLVREHQFPSVSLEEKRSHGDAWLRIKRGIDLAKLRYKQQRLLKSAFINEVLG